MVRRNEAGHRHLGVSLRDGRIAIGDPAIPSPTMGKWSGRNITGWEKVRKDLPKITKTWSWESPNFGDGSTYGYHTSSRTERVFQVEYYEPQNLRISAQLLSEPTADARVALFKFEIEATLDRTKPEFDRNLLYYLNVLQENTGAADVFRSDATRADFMKEVFVDWVVFPPGTREEEILAAFGKTRAGARAVPEGPLRERIRLFASLKPQNLLRGTGAFDAYVGAQFADDLVVFENINYGNALYVLYDEWREISQRSRLELLKGTHERYDRFVHTDGWQDRFKDHIKRELRKRSKPRAA